ncbi:alanine--tRNA ligase [Pseudenhygromyxa sp. WMMC2535]|uniref:alanine--tRNA ligase n=1 Tax=Pseudenhygromyxa sp. WMMC2535 TaxID=2712867 RepID=UPI001554E08A|nr:alanine--tRNA ligase [Pseudenhygromyxa sp. WMMC2535]NVB36845.1 alanine--tRNA ligase [Pseudenhygromyxa sp. WMMC2535]
MARFADAHEIRSTFLRFYEERGHAVVPSSPLVPFDDPTLLFVNAGMVQFKDVFTGRDKRDYSRATSAQRCLRAGGKHNDLDNVGFTPRHHTLFEMLGNFSFGDYFKADAIRWAWTLLTEVLEIPASRLVVSVFNGEGEDAPFDQEAFDLWAEIIPRERIYAFDAKENFWQMGDTGPCGPCSEIHIFLEGDEAPPDAGKPKMGPAFEDRRYMELWNLVFMQYEKLASGEMNRLPAPSVDTGAGLERLAAVLEGARSNYETSLFRPIVDRAKSLAGVSGDQGEHEASFRVIADHARAAAFLIADGVTPEQSGRPYVLRRIMRRAIRHGSLVGLDELFFHKVCDEVVQRFSDAYPELLEAREAIEGAVRIEEEGFRRTLNRGLRRVSKIIEGLDEGASEFPVDEAADLYTSAGFPVDLTRVIAEENDLRLDEAAVAERLEALKGDAGFAGVGAKVSDVYFEIAKRLGKGSEFLGYEVDEGEGTLLAIVVPGEGEGEDAAELVEIQEAGVGQRVELIFDRTPFYAESGGQAGDTGEIRFAHSDQGPGSDARLRVEDTRKPTGGLHVHVATVEQGAIRVGDRFALRVEAARRDAIRRNHSATHLLHHALRAELGKHVTQKGSLVAPERLRFDFSHGGPLTREETREIEARVNAMIVANAPSGTAQMSLPEAKEAGAIGLFGEKYGDQVRVVTIGGDSVELCGGTHVRRAGDIGLFKIIAEGGVAQGVRRIEAVTGLGALRWVQDTAAVLEDVGAELHARDQADVMVRLGKLQEELADKRREVDSLKRKLTTGGAAAGKGDEVVEVSGVKLIARRVPVADPKIMREAADTLRDRMGSGVVVLAGERDGKANLLVAATKDLAGKTVHAGKLAAALITHVDGRGGGRPDMAQAGGPKVAGLDELIAAAPASLQAQLG